ncbi:hypothetical protein GGI22_006210, partial [Coemansia erecta]
MSESSTVLSTEALTAAMEAAAAAPGQTEAATEPQLLSPFPALDSDHEKEEKEEDPMAAAQFRPDDIGTATAAALSSAITRAQIPVVDGAHAFSFAAQPQGVASNGGGGLATTAMMGAPPVMTSASTQDESVLATLQRSAHDQVMEIMSSYHSTNAHRRRSSVEAVAAASSVLASFANSAKSYMDGEAAAAALAAAAAVNSSPPQITQMSSYSTQAAQHNAAAAALLAASGMHTVMLPTIPSVSTSLQGTPAPGERLSLSGGMDDESLMSAAATSAAMAAISSPITATSGAPSAMTVAAGDSSMQHVLDMAAFSSLSPTSLAAANQITSDMASASIAASATLQASHSGQGALSVETTPQNKKRKTRGGRQRKAVAGVSAATAAAIAVADPALFNEQPAKRRMYSDDDDDEDDDDDGLLDRAENGMPLTPDAPG